MSREPLPVRRFSESRDFLAAGMSFTATLGFYDDGRVGEVFIDGPKAGSDAEVNASDAAVLLSILLQHDISPAVLRRGMARDEEGRPLGPIGAVVDMLAGDGQEAA
ncbi:hypothetical protein [Ancylobacter pratisalsi]|uniref:ribonucleoside-diphosphate reductase n=1 Tax=Ancylobacter pratisalsi TaxID=1745854 RepID=A0A6P1YHC2_9HYPH|nr:hypothetical protein [Ancylobacter pratisalsi]QIB32649.1 hypothetical protein G3A50_02225 [Ancylobacter pratisalsi]